VVGLHSTGISAGTHGHRRRRRAAAAAGTPWLPRSIDANWSASSFPDRRGRGDPAHDPGAPALLYRAAALVAMAGFVQYHSTDAVPAALAGLVVVGLGVGLLYPTSLSVAMPAAPGAEAQASTRSALASGLAIGSDPLALGTLADAAGLDAAS
jgi:MFS family permease